MTANRGTTVHRIAVLSDGSAPKNDAKILAPLTALDDPARQVYPSLDIRPVVEVRAKQELHDAFDNIDGGVVIADGHCWIHRGRPIYTYTELDTATFTLTAQGLLMGGCNAGTPTFVDALGSRVAQQTAFLACRAVTQFKHGVRLYPEVLAALDAATNAHGAALPAVQVADCFDSALAAMIARPDRLQVKAWARSGPARRVHRSLNEYQVPRLIP
jgi:hypothetical protein